ncbi:MAG TPA: endonuclease/exonuclease/phosphatase family protein [Kiritimatiellia bacterium]|nr:endonuclease/exonuclease/phosphatase family protein [Kiritimatiellia bacterium]HMO97923.1 endonuclease/exonuclease/phosphatase family protein [Kiritimatiellia bacterium]HMP95274.1 endonuclease/exonuclease/phosphatase family protein [Kiritimatiellia bacterium]
MNAARIMFRAGMAAWLLAFASGCRRPEQVALYPPPAGSGEFAMMFFNLDHFALADRDGDGQADDFKPDGEVDALVAVIARARPAILAVQEVGDDEALRHLQTRLHEAGHRLDYRSFLPPKDAPTGLGLLSRFPLVDHSPASPFTYSIRERALAVQRGFQHVEVNLPEGRSLRIVHAHLKSKDFHEAGQTEMRRNEARLLATYVRRIQREFPDAPLLVCGDFGDHPGSGTLRDIFTWSPKTMMELSVADAHGDRWTYFSRREHAYFHTSTILANPALASRHLKEKSMIIRDPRVAGASDHRPVVAAFRIW